LLSAGLQGIAGQIGVDGDAVNRSNVLHVAVPVHEGLRRSLLIGHL